LQVRPYSNIDEVVDHCRCYLNFYNMMEIVFKKRYKLDNCVIPTRSITRISLVVALAKLLGFNQHV